MEANQAGEILRRPAVTRKTGLATSSLYAAIARGEFPKPIPIGVRSVGWLSREVDAWIEERAAKRDTSAVAWRPRGARHREDQTIRGEER